MDKIRGVQVIQNKKYEEMLYIRSTGDFINKEICKTVFPGRAED
jgi:hypothetical protein